MRAMWLAAVLVVLTGCGADASEGTAEVPPGTAAATACPATGCPGGGEEDPCEGGCQESLLTLRAYNNCPQDAYFTLAVRTSPDALAAPVTSNKFVPKTTNFTATAIAVPRGEPFWVTATVQLANGVVLAPVTVETAADTETETFIWECHDAATAGPFVWGMMSP